MDGDPSDPGATARLVEKVGGLGRVAVVGTDDPVLSSFEVMAYPTLLHTHGGVVTASGTKLADFAGVNPSLVVTAFQSASGLLNLVTPTSAVVMGGLAIARVPYGTYLRFVWPLLVILGVLTIVVLALGAAV